MLWTKWYNPPPPDTCVEVLAFSGAVCRGGSKKAMRMKRGRQDAVLTQQSWRLDVVFSLHALLCPGSPSFMKTTVRLDQGPTLVQEDLILADYICSDPVSKKHHVLKYWR